MLSNRHRELFQLKPDKFQLQVPTSFFPSVKVSARTRINFSRFITLDSKEANLIQTNVKHKA